MADLEEDERPDDGRPPEVVFSGGGTLRLNLAAIAGDGRDGD